MNPTFPLPIDDIISGLDEILSHCKADLEIGTLGERIVQRIEDKASGVRNMLVAGSPPPTAVVRSDPDAAITVDHTGCEYISRDVELIERLAAEGSEGATEVVYLFAGSPPPISRVETLDWSNFDGPKRNAEWKPDDQDLIYTAINFRDDEWGDADEDAGQQIVERLLAAWKATADGIEQASRQLVEGGELLLEAETVIAEMTELCRSAKDVIASASDTYKKRNGHKGSFEDDSGEKCWIVPFEAFEGLRSAVAAISSTAKEEGQ